METFYITLPSTASSNLYDNSQSHFRVQLPSPIELKGEWLVGLSEIHVPTAWNNVVQSTNTFKLHLQPKVFLDVVVPDFSFRGIKWNPHNNTLHHITSQIPDIYKPHFRFQNHILLNSIQTELTMDPGYDISFNGKLSNILKFHGGKFQSVAFQEVEHTSEYKGGDLKMTLRFPKIIKTTEHKIPVGLYSKVDHILQAMIDHILQAMTELTPEDIAKEIRFKHNRDGTVTAVLGKRIVLEFPKENHGLGSLLGFADDQTRLTDITTGKYPVDLNGGVHGLYVYTDIINPHIVGDTMAPLLRVIPIEYESKYSYVKVYSNPDFFQLIQNRFESIEIDIRTDSGARLSFRHGKTLVKLLFKRV